MRRSARLIQLFAATLACSADADAPSQPAPVAPAIPPPATPLPQPSVTPPPAAPPEEAVRRTSSVERVSLGEEHRGWLWLAVTFVNDTREPAWFVLHFPSEGSSDGTIKRRGTRVHVEKIAAEDGGKARWLQICDDDAACDYAVRLAPGQLLEIEPVQRAVEADGPPLVAEIWRLSALRFDHQPAELWLADEFTPATHELRGRPLFASREHPPLARRGGTGSPQRVDLEPAERLVFDISTAPPPRRRVP
ncbi:hypothetical protein [Nannocystis punicea]|uniref:DUF4384 domain-containing protein n=1 Tax=Nannocystis punicea TaxID=2995304 RepID=A0ABY7HBE6_9BACT|nr:hypothetical protein [Nannocystis poenicansa]WAS96425.1 hypothetical protein O0S08_09725 [Nannocystis poenicansa]